MNTVILSIKKQINIKKYPEKEALEGMVTDMCN